MSEKEVKPQSTPATDDTKERAIVFASVWDAIEDTPEETDKMKALSEALMWFQKTAKEHPEPLTMNAQTGGALITGQISRIDMAVLFGICRANNIETATLENICARHNQPIPEAT